MASERVHTNNLCQNSARCDNICRMVESSRLIVSLKMWNVIQLFICDEFRTSTGRLQLLKNQMPKYYQLSIEWRWYVQSSSPNPMVAWCFAARGNLKGHLCADTRIRLSNRYANKYSKFVFIKAVDVGFVFSSIQSTSCQKKAFTHTKSLCGRVFVFGLFHNAILHWRPQYQTETSDFICE